MSRPNDQKFIDNIFSCFVTVRNCVIRYMYEIGPTNIKMLALDPVHNY